MAAKQKVIYKYSLTSFGHGTIIHHVLDAEAKIIKAGFQNKGHNLVCWAEVDPSPQKFRKYEFITYWTGIEFESPESVTGFKYLGTDEDVNGLVYHVYYRMIIGYVQQPESYRL